MPGGHSTLNTVVLGEGVSKYSTKYTPYFGHHSSRLYRVVPARYVEPATGSRRAGAQRAVDPRSSHVYQELRG
jgi:hypothetical protein